MSEKQNDTLEQRKKAQEEFIKLKKMQSGEMAPEPKPSEVAVMPKTFSQKLKNFWYHYKWHTLISLFLCFVLVIGVAQCASREKYDAKVVLYTNNYYYDGHINALGEYMSQYFTDINGDGEVKIQVLDCSYVADGKGDTDYINSLSTRLNSTLSGDGSVQLFIVDQKNYEHLNTVFDSVDEFFVDSAPLPDDVHEFFKEKDLELPKDLIIGRRIVEGTLIEKEKDIEVYTKENTAALNKIKQKVTK